MAKIIQEQEEHQNLHGREIIYLVNDGFYNHQGKINDIEIVRDSLKNSFSISAWTPLSEETAFRFGRMFEPSKFPSNNSDGGLIALGKAMIQPKGFKDNSSTPAGYTFLGQFIDHDMAFDGMRLVIPDGEIDISQIISKRSPTLELDSLYGRNKILEGGFHFPEELYKPDKIHFKIGRTLLTSQDMLHQIDIEYSNDLLRNTDQRVFPGEKVQKAVIGDERNDENLAIAQMHVAFLRFHNAVVDRLQEKGVASDKLFEAAREIVIKHYQWIILEDFLSRIINKGILDKVIGWAKTGDSKNLKWLPDKTDPFIPIEFSGAAFRFGHSVLQDKYEWNRVFESPNVNGTFENLFKFTGNSSMDGAARLPSGWIVDWSRFFDFTKHGIAPVQEKFNTSRKIDTHLVFNLISVPGFRHVEEVFRNLAVRNLLRSRSLRMPTGQEVASSLSSKLSDGEPPILSPEQIAKGEHSKILEDHNFIERTPLWYYILKEAEEIGKGERLGTVGSYIMAETFVKLIQRSDISIFNDDWNPQQDPLIDPEILPKGFGMADLIKFAESEADPLINPLGN